MNLYVFQPKEPYAATFYVMAEGEEKARKAVDRQIKVYAKDLYGAEYTWFREWRSNDYNVVIVDPEVAIIHQNC